MATNLAPVYVNESRVALQGDPKPRISKILEACGMGSNAQVFRLENQNDSQGKSLKPEDVIDRTNESESAVYLKCVDKSNPASASAGYKPGQPSQAGKGLGTSSKASGAAEGGPGSSGSSTAKQSYQQSGQQPASSGYAGGQSGSKAGQAGTGSASATQPGWQGGAGTGLPSSPSNIASGGEKGVTGQYGSNQASGTPGSKGPTPTGSGKAGTPTGTSGSNYGGSGGTGSPPAQGGSSSPTTQQGPPPASGQASGAGAGKTSFATKQTEMGKTPGDEPGNADKVQAPYGAKGTSTMSKAAPTPGQQPVGDEEE